MLVERVVAEACLRDGANRFVPKDAPSSEILDATATVMAGHPYLSPRVPKHSHHLGPAALHPGFEKLTPRQQQILLLLGRGKRPAQIASALGLTRSTITFHLGNLMRVLGMRSDDELLRFAVLMLGPPAEG